MAKGKKPKPGREARNGQWQKQQNKKSAPRRSRAHSQASDYNNAVFSMHDAARATDYRKSYTATATRLRYMAMNFVRGNEPMEQDSDLEGFEDEAKHKTEALKPATELRDFDAFTAPTIERCELTTGIDEETCRPAVSYEIPQRDAIRRMSVRHSPSPSSSSDEVVFKGRNNMERNATRSVTFQNGQSRTLEALEPRISPVRWGRPGIQPLEESNMLYRLEASSGRAAEDISPTPERESLAQVTLSSSRMSPCNTTPYNDSDTEGGLDDYISNMQENDEANLAINSYLGAVAKLESPARTVDEAIVDQSTAVQYDESRSDGMQFEFNWSSDSDLDDAAYEALEDFDEGNLIAKRIARMTDAHIARLFQKQEDLGLNADDLQLFDGDEDLDVSEHSLDNQENTSKHKQHQKRRKENSRSLSSRLCDHVWNGEDYGDFDVMDRERPSISKGKSQHLDPFPLDLSDSELAEGLRDAWASDRKKKRLKKKEREELRAQGLLGKNSNDIPDLKTKYIAGMTLTQVETELRGFLFNGQKEALSLPPMAKQERKMIHDIANSFGLKSKSQGSNKKRFTVLYKTSKTIEFDDVAFSRLKMQLNRRFLPRMDGKGKRNSKAPNGVPQRNIGYRDGEVVGGAAPELGAENRGRTMLEKMGWSTGTALGALNNQGILKPIEHVVKNSRAGLG